MNLKQRIPAATFAGCLITFVIDVGNPKEPEPALMKYWEIIADNLKKAGWSLGWVSAIDLEGQTIWIADAHRGNGNVSLRERMKS